MTNYRNKYKPRKNTPKSERKAQRSVWAENTRVMIASMSLKGLHTNPAVLERGFGHPVRGRKK